MTRKFDSEKRNKSTWNALSERFALANFQFRDQKVNSPHLTNSMDVKFRWEIIFGRIQCSTNSYEEICVQKTIITILKYVRDISHNHDFDGSIERFDISSLFFITSLRFLMYNLMEKYSIPWRRRSSTTRNKLNQPETNPLDVSHSWIFNASIKKVGCPILCYTIGVKFPIDISLE